MESGSKFIFYKYKTFIVLPFCQELEKRKHNTVKSPLIIFFAAMY